MLLAYSNVTIQIFDSIANHRSAGTTDSALTTHGVLQANRLGIHLSTSKVSHIFSSDLQRAVKTAEAIRAAQDRDIAPREVSKLELLREQDFGFYEGKKFFERPNDSNKSGKEAHLEAHRNDPGFKDVESRESMRTRMNTFIDGHLVHLFQGDHSVVVVAHGIILSHLWRSILRRFSFENVSVIPDVSTRGISLEFLGGWSNTGYLDAEINPILSAAQFPEATAPKPSPLQTPAELPKKPVASVAEVGISTIPLPEKSPASIPSPPTPSKAKPELLKMSLVVKAVNSLEHLKGLKKTRGGIGSLKHDSNQKTMDSFFKKRKLNE